jgi:hypothetical protein
MMFANDGITATPIGEDHDVSISATNFCSNGD